MAWGDLGHKRIALSEPRSQPANDDRQFGLVVDDAIITSSSRNATPTKVETALRERLGILGVATDPAAMASDERVCQALQAEVDGVNRRYARTEQVHDLTQATEQLTPTIKVKRDVVYDRHGETLERLYA